MISPEDLSESIVFSSSLRSSWAKKIAATYNLLKEKSIDSVEKLDEVIKESKSAVRDTRESIREIEAKIADINDTLKYAERVSKYRPVYNEYLESGKSQSLYETHRTEIMLYESAQATLKQKGLHGESVRLSQLPRERSALEDQKLDLSISLECIFAHISNAFYHNSIPLLSITDINIFNFSTVILSKKMSYKEYKKPIGFSCFR